MEPRDEQQSRFRMEKLEDRIAPAHLLVLLPEAALEHNNEQADHLIGGPGSRGGFGRVR